MDTASHTSPPAWFRAVSLIGVIWHAYGFIIYLNSVGTFGDPGFSAAERAAVSSMPVWITGADALGPFFGVIGSLGLLLGKKWAQPVLIASLVALLVLVGWILFLSGAVDQFGGVAIPIIIVASAILLVWLASYARKRAWLS